MYFKIIAKTQYHSHHKHSPSKKKNKLPFFTGCGILIVILIAYIITMIMIDKIDLGMGFRYIFFVYLSTQITLLCILLYAMKKAFNKFEISERKKYLVSKELTYGAMLMMIVFIVRLLLLKLIINSDINRHIIHWFSFVLYYFSWLFLSGILFYRLYAIEKLICISLVQIIMSSIILVLTFLCITAVWTVVEGKLVGFSFSNIIFIRKQYFPFVLI